MRRWALTVVVLAWAFAAAIAIARVPTGPRTARAAARRILAGARLPPGAQRSDADPSGGRLAKPGAYPLTPDLVDLHSFWRASGDPASVFDWIQSHPPAGVRSSGGGGVASSSGAVREQWAAFSFVTPRSGGAPAETLLVTVTPARGGGTAIRVDAQVVWLLERPRSERIPSGVLAITVSERTVSGQAGGPWRITARARLRRAASILDALPAGQPGVVACPAFAGPTVTLTFSSRTGGRLARAVIDGGGCEFVNLWLHGRPQHALQGNPQLIHELSVALGVSL